MKMSAYEKGVKTGRNPKIRGFLPVFVPVSIIIYKKEKIFLLNFTKKKIFFKKV